MAPGLGFQHKGKGGITINIDGFDRVHLDSDAERSGHAIDPGSGLSRGLKPSLGRRASLE
jgi:hypothetical protein